METFSLETTDFKSSDFRAWVGCDRKGPAQKDVSSSHVIDPQ